MKKIFHLFNRRRLSLAILAILAFSIFSLSAPQIVYAQTDVNQSINNVLTPIWAFLKKAYEKGGAAAFQKAVRTALNKIAYDTSTWLGSGSEGQKPMFVTKGWGEYLTQIGDEAAGQFIEDAVNNWATAKDRDNKKDECSSKVATCLSDAGVLSPPDKTACLAKCSATYTDCRNNCTAVGAQKTVCLSMCSTNKNVCDAACSASVDAAGAAEKKCMDEYYACAGTVTTDAAGVTSLASNNITAVCQPSSVEAKLQIALGLVDYNRPQAPNCTASEMIKNWDDYATRMTAFREADFLDKFKGIFNPVSNDLGIYMSLRTDMTKDIENQVESSKTKLIANGGWLDLQDIAGNLVGMPGDAETKKEIADQGYISNMATFSGDALIDAANVFLNQLAVTAFSKYMSKLGQTAASNNSAAISSASTDPNVSYGEAAVQESAAKLIEPNFTVRADYDILSALSTCRDRNNPGPTECVIDDKLMQAITEKKTVAEAAQDGYLHKDWLFTSDYRDGAYSLRNLQIMRQYRIVPVGWEVAAASGKPAALTDLMSCFDANDAYNDYTSNFDTHNQSWCRGLVDPNWVLKAPLNYCAKQGYGAQILSTVVVPGVDQNGKTGSDSIQITRAEDYCADDKTCIKEKSDGSCEAYGYCQSERRTWNFDSKSCEPINNTCRAFSNISSGQKVAYLENTLDYGDCSADSAGCKRYSLFGTYASSTGQVVWSTSVLNTSYFNGKLSGCSSSDEGCKEMLRVKPGWGSNLIMGAGFFNDNIGDQLVNGKVNNYWPIWSNTASQTAASIINASDLDNNSAGKALLLEASSTSVANVTTGLYSDNAASLLPSNLNILSGETYTLSADVYLVQGDKVQAVLGGDYQTYSEDNTLNSWQHISITRSLKDKPLSELSFQIVGYGSTGQRVKFAVQNLKLEMTPWDTGFSSYGSYKVYQKLIPNYLAAACYLNADSSNPDYRLRADAPAVCNNFARQCNRDEAGCERYQETSTGFSVAAQAVSSDYCDASCNGYDMYVARSSYFYSPFAENLIPQDSQACSADAAGCSEFTNLDAAASGGENKEYYTQMKQCVKPGTSCADFYTWVGTEESGYQLKSLVLKKSGDGNPAVTADDSQDCNQDIFNLPPSDPRFNADCKQYYNKAGQVSYHLSAGTITCSDDCHTYRLAENNVDTTLTQTQCQGLPDRFWNAASSVCYVCKNGGTWSDQYQSCLYQAIPGEGKKCAASQKGCREYNGSLGNNTTLIAAYSFEDGTDGWEGQCGDDALNSKVVDVNNGQSLLYDSGANATGAIHQTDCNSNTTVSLLDRIFGAANANPASYIRQQVGGQVAQGQAYSLKFTASAAADTAVSFAFLNGKGDISYFNATEANPTGSFMVKGNGEWKTYSLNLASLDHEVDDNESLIIAADKDFYLDNLTVTAINDRYYLIKDTSQVPDVCYYDMLDNYQGADYNLGCSAYTDRAGTVNYLRQFSRLCQNSAVGCELMIDTANYNDYKKGIWKDTNANGQCDPDEHECLTVPGDRFFYAIYDEAHRCNAADSGCSRLGEASSAGSNLTWSDVFKINEPDNYNQSLCNAGDAGCEAWTNTDGSGTSYFKNPGNNACVYRNSADPTQSGKYWYKVPVMRCDLNNNGKIDGAEQNGSVCASADDCQNKRPCLVDSNDYPCPVSYLKTLGTGGAGNQIPVPTDNAGLCEAAASGCTEYIDPVSVFSPNIIVNPGMDTENGWNNVSGAYQQNIKIEPNKLYLFYVVSAQNGSAISNDVTLAFPSGVSLLQEDNNFSSTTSQLLTIHKEQPAQRFLFYSRGNNTALVSGGHNGFSVVVKEAITDYQLQQNIDKTSCNGLVNFNNGCILFNERSVNGGQGLLSLSSGWNAASSTDGQTPVACTAGNCSANQLLKVRPNRVCASWLDCLTYVEDATTKKRTCYALGECNRLNDNNECANFIDSKNSVLASNSIDLNKATGYSILNRYNLASMEEVGLNTDAHYNFEDASPLLSCRDASNHAKGCNFDNSITADSIVSSPTGAPTDYPAEGKAYLRVMAGQEMSPLSQNSFISIQKNRDYYLNYLVNTKGSGVNAKVSLYNGANMALLAEFSDSASNRWERKVHRIASSTLANVTSLSLYLSADTTDKEEKYVYFDDINIEPVLRVGSDQYVAKECRLYPSQDATSCTSKNSQVISDGLSGYCLQHDPANQNICLLWYPIDQISADIKSARSSFGYQGAYPLNYCTEANGNFDLIEKRKTVFIKYTGHSGGNPGCYIYDSSCGGDSNYWTIHDYSSGGDWQRDYCVPKLDNAVVQKDVILPDAQACGKDAGIVVNYVSGKSNSSVPTNASVRVSDIWAPYNGFSFFKKQQEACGDCSPFDTVGANLDEYTNANPPVRVFDYDHPTADENDLKLISGDTDKVFYPTCNRFVQVVDSGGNNKAWTGRTSKNSIYPYETPLFFRDASNYYGSTSNFKFTNYGRNRDLVPFGAATFPDNFNIFASDPIKFRNQYSSKIDQVAFAGRPYGCTGDGCNNLGYCSLNPNVLCIRDTTTSASSSLINQRSCGSANGTCVPMWNGSLVASDANFKAENILKNLFLKSFAGYAYSPSIQSYINGDGYLNGTGGSYINGSLLIGQYGSHNTGNDANFSAYWKIVLPKINNVKLNGQLISSSTGVTINSRGIYALTFNSVIDPEQQPLKDLVIDWGDGTLQSLVNQDYRPDALNPHTIYHYYRQEGRVDIKIKISDNWDTYCCSKNNGACSSSASDCPGGLAK